LAGGVTLVISLPANAQSPMEVTLFGMATLVRPLLANALISMEISVRHPILSGITTGFTASVIIVNLYTAAKPPTNFKLIF
jgi:multidrug transporter EmrE-like cation transporter